MEFLLVTYWAERDVLVDGVVAGLTNHLLTLAPGTYTIALAGDADFIPSKQTCVVSGTSPLDPAEVHFV